MPPYHQHVHCRRCGPSLFKGVLLVGLGFWLARAAERRRVACDAGPAPAGPPAGPPSAPATAPGHHPWSGRGAWCRRPDAAAPSPAPLPASGPAGGPAGGSAPAQPVPLARGSDAEADAGAVLAALAAYQQRAAPAVVPQLPPAPSPAHASLPVSERSPATDAAPPAARPDAQEAASEKRRQDLARIERLGAALERMRAALDKEQEAARLV